MARAREGRNATEQVRQFRTAEEIDSVIVKLRRRATEIETLGHDNIRHHDDRVENVEHSVRDTIREEFGKDSPEFQRHQYFVIDDGPRTARLDYFGTGYDYDAEDQERFVRCIPGAVGRVVELIRRLEERRLDLTASYVAPRVAFEGCVLHSAIADAARQLFYDGHYAQAVFEAGKALINMVKTRSGRPDLDGVPLMQTAFSVNDPILAFNDGTDRSDSDEQLGMMYLFQGAAIGVRNPGGHRIGVIERPERALQHLQLFSLLADRVGETRKLK